MPGTSFHSPFARYCRSNTDGKPCPWYLGKIAAPVIFALFPSTPNHRSEFPAAMLAVAKVPPLLIAERFEAPAEAIARVKGLSHTVMRISAYALSFPPYTALTYVMPAFFG